MSALVQTNGTATAATSNAWLRSSVREFFTAFNWEDHPPEVQEVQQQNLQSGDTLSLSLTVGQFFRAIPWDGAIAQPLALDSLMNSEPSDPANAFTLDDFSDFF